MSPGAGAAERITVQCCVAGGGPAGLMLGLLLARAGVRVLVLEKHADFLRDFRGDTIHPSTMELMHELGLLEEFLRLPHQEVRRLVASVGDTELPIADFSHLPTRCRFLALMPQWDFLNFLTEHAGRHSAFALRMRTEVTDLVRDGDRVTGVRATTPTGTLEVRAALVVGADGRSSVVRAGAGLIGDDLGAPMDVLWFRLSRQPGDPGQTMGRFAAGSIVVQLDRGDYWQVAYVIPKGSADTLRASGLEAFRAAVATAAPPLAGRIHEIRSWDDAKLLTVRIDRLRRWHGAGVLCIGDAAHAMSPVGGVGINLAIQDAVAAANLLAEPLREDRLTVDDLARVQRRRELPTRVIQRLQIVMQRVVIRRVLASRQRMQAPLVIRLLARIPWLQRIPARLVGLGVRPEHVRVPR